MDELYMDNNNSKQTKLFEFFNEFDHIEKDTFDNEFAYLDENIVKIKYKDKLVFKFKSAYCPECHNIDVSRTGYSKRSLIFLKYGEINCHLQRYKCKYCNFSFIVDLSCIISGNRNISIAVVDKIRQIHLSKTTNLLAIQEK